MGKYPDVMDILDKLAEALGDSQGQTLEDIKKDIEEEGVDYKAAMKRLRDRLKEELNKLRRTALDQARNRRIYTATALKDRLAEFAALSREEKLSRLKDLIDGGFMAPKVAYRDFTSADEEDLGSIYEDAELARIMANEQESQE
jgi:hypothetical protein